MLARQNKLTELLDLNLQQRIEAVSLDLDTRKDSYAFIKDIDLANALEVPLKDIDLDWTIFGVYGYVYLDESHTQSSENSLNVALDELYSVDALYHSFATFDVNMDLRFEVSLNGDYGSIDGLRTPYNLRDDNFKFFYWHDMVLGNDKSDGYLDETSNMLVNEVWLEARKSRDEELGEVINFIDKLKWIKNNFKDNVEIVIFRFFNDE